MKNVPRIDFKTPTKGSAAQSNRTPALCRGGGPIIQWHGVPKNRRLPSWEAQVDIYPPEQYQCHDTRTRRSQGEWGTRPSSSSGRSRVVMITLAERPAPMRHGGDPGFYGPAGAPFRRVPEATKSAQLAGINHKRRAHPNAYLGRKPSFDWATFDRIRLALDRAPAEPIGHREGRALLSKQTVFRLKHDPQAALAALDAWGL
jgi:hypothetical protein